MKTAEDILNDKISRMVSISPDKTVLETVRLMVDKKIGAILISKDDKIVGIWTERDLMRNLVLPDFNMKTARVGDYMTTSLYTANASAPVFKLEEMFLGLFIRHIIVEKEGKYIGLISIGDVLRASLLEKDQKFKELNSFVSWEYYEDWGWDRKKR